MYTLYLDASGDPGKYVGKNTRHFVLAGVVSQPEDWFSLAGGIEKVLDSHFGPSVPRPEKLRYYDLIHGKFPFDKVDRKGLADDIFDVITEGDLTLFAIVVNKEEHWNKYAEPDPPNELALELTAERFQWFLEKKEDVGMIVHDREPTEVHKALLGLFERYKEKGTRYKEIENIIDTIFFTPSQTSPPPPTGRLHRICSIQQVRAQKGRQIQPDKEKIRPARPERIPIEK